MVDGALAEAVRSLMPRARRELAELVAFRSVANPSLFPVEECRASARWVADALAAEGVPDVRLLEVPDGSTAVYGHLPGPDGAPTVLLYAHHDVQPPLDEAAWTSPPFELTERDGRWYGRGAADCKGNILMHLTALRALRQVAGVKRDGATGVRAVGEGLAGEAVAPLPVTVKVIVDGSEEQGTGGLERYVAAHPELLAADAIVVGDAGNFATGVPTATTSLRGTVVLRVTVRTLAGNLHSGQFGGAAPDALAALIRLLDGLRDEHGGTAVPGLESYQAWEGLEYPEGRFREDAGVLDGVELIGTGSVADRLWARPAITVVGIDAPSVDGAVPAIQSRARALLSLRVPPGTDAEAARRALVSHLEGAAPWGARVEVEPWGTPAQPMRADTSGPAYAALGEAMREAFGREMVLAGQGGSIPLCELLRRTYPEAEMVLLGVEDPGARIHAVDESVDPGELERMALAEALFLRGYAARWTGRPARRSGVGAAGA
ncbi:dipeptidase [Allostreptomyces psammosilenae]|uniref:Acetylornithine deacetylase/succinyl-diaminopimelate desuccinylase-like protein n=1 Tax=Allostreptomyces psammosilenae TaxID=1892865 RepID=A0A852ZYG6_9ACTN|nr:dipeptidase [Allostreptomyces psammosilenae]NYI07423.1 acetylornithine deacetylase/succinyl-diaminopimelate desuccinylase-like protein [Allostreptomyces psammosilenae]